MGDKAKAKPKAKAKAKPKAARPDVDVTVDPVVMTGRDKRIARRVHFQKAAKARQARKGRR